MATISIQIDHDLDAMTPDELVALNQDLGAAIDEIRAYRRLIKEVHDAKLGQMNSTDSASTDAVAFPEG